MEHFIHLDKRLGSICSHTFREGNYAVKALARLQIILLMLNGGLLCLILLGLFLL